MLEQLFPCIVLTCSCGQLPMPIETVVLHQASKLDYPQHVITLCMWLPLYHPGLLLGTEAPDMMPNDVDVSFHSSAGI